MTHADLEEALGRAYLALPSGQALDHMDGRVADALSRATRPPVRSLVGRRLALAVAMSVVVFATVGAGGIAMLERMFREASGGLELAWQRATALGLRDTVRGTTVGVERAYLDGAQIVVGLTSEGYNYADARLWVDGRRAAGGFVSGVPTRHGSAHMLVFQTPPGVGDRAELVLEVRDLWRNERADDPRSDDPLPAASPERGTGDGPPPTVIEGPWRFAFSLRNQGAVTVWTGAATATASGVTMTLDRLSVAPTLIKGHLSWEGTRLAASGDDVWSAQGRLRHRGERLGIDGGGTSGNQFEFRIERGADDPVGEWTLRIDTITSDPGSPPRQVRIEGPWVFHVTLPD